MSRTSLDPSVLGLGNGNTTFVGVGKNRILNGDMQIDQANGGGALVVNNTGPFFSVDMFKGIGTASAGVFTLQRNGASLSPFANFLRATVTTNSASPAAGATYRILQSIEGYMLAGILTPTGCNAFTLSFWVRSSVTGSFTVGTIIGSNTNIYYLVNYTISAANTWTYITVSIPATSITTGVSQTTSTGMNVFWDLGSGSSSEGVAATWTTGSQTRIAGATRLISTNGVTLDLVGVQLEAGSVATPYEFRSYGEMLWLCQRYFEVSYSRDFPPGSVTNQDVEHTVSAVVGVSETWGVAIPFKAPKRAAPTMSLYNGTTGASGTWLTTNTSGTTTTTAVTSQYSAFRYFGIHNSVNNNPYGEGHWVADARL